MIAAIRAWAARHTSKGRYSPVGVAFHWGMALIVIFMLGLGWYMGRVEPGGDKLWAFELHMVIGLTTLFFGLMRLFWRLVIPGPINDADAIGGWQGVAARLTHHAFYVSFVGLPVSGWLMWSAFADADRLDVVGPLVIAPFPFETLSFEWRNAILNTAKLTHSAFIWLLLLLIPAHVGAALKHHFWDRHDVLEAMLPILIEEKSPKARKRKPKRRPSPPRSRPARSAA